MKIKTSFTIDIDPDSLELLREQSGEVATNREAAEFIRMDCPESYRSYLEGLGIKVRSLTCHVGKESWEM